VGGVYYLYMFIDCSWSGLLFDVFSARVSVDVNQTQHSQMRCLIHNTRYEVLMNQNANASTQRINPLISNSICPVRSTNNLVLSSHFSSFSLKQVKHFLKAQHN
jgi:hypothetical protein